MPAIHRADLGYWRPTRLSDRERGGAILCLENALAWVESSGMAVGNPDHSLVPLGLPATMRNGDGLGRMDGSPFSERGLHVNRPA